MLPPFEPEAKIRVLLAERFPEARARLEQALAEERGFELAGAADDFAALEELAAAEKPDVILLDAALPGSSLKKAGALQKELAGARIILLGFAEQPEIRRDALRAGLGHVLLKPFSDEALLTAIRTAAASSSAWREAPLRSGPGSYLGMKNRITARLAAQGLNKQIVRLLQEAFEQTLATERIVLSRPERQRLFTQILHEFLDQIKQDHTP